jgi:hypothetical protein
MEVNGYLQAPASLPRVKSGRYILQRRLGVPQSRFGIFAGKQKYFFTLWESNHGLYIAQHTDGTTVLLNFVACRN